MSKKMLDLQFEPSESRRYTPEEQRAKLVLDTERLRKAIEMEEERFRRQLNRLAKKLKGVPFWFWEQWEANDFVRLKHLQVGVALGYEE